MRQKSLRDFYPLSSAPLGAVVLARARPARITEPQRGSAHLRQPLWGLLPSPTSSPARIGALPKGPSMHDTGLRTHIRAGVQERKPIPEQACLHSPAPAPAQRADMGACSRPPPHSRALACAPHHAPYRACHARLTCPRHAYMHAHLRPRPHVGPRARRGVFFAIKEIFLVLPNEKTAFK